LRAELAKDDIDVLVICPGLTQTNFSQNMIEKSARLPLDHLRGMTAEKVALATLQAIERGQNEVCLTAQGRLLVFLNRFFPRLVDRLAARKVRQLFRDEVAGAGAGGPPQAERRSRPRIASDVDCSITSTR
jgi:short-subunit dehydrogenase